MTDVTVKYIPAGDDHEDSKWIVLEGSVDGWPQVTKRRTINTAALAAGTLTIEGEKAALVADVLEYLDRYQAVQAVLDELT